MPSRLVLACAWLLVLFSGSVWAADIYEIEERVYREVPMSIHVRPGTERILVFPDPVEIRVPGELGSKLESLQINGTTLSLKPRKAFTTSRLIVNETAGSQVYLLDLTASPDGSDRASVLRIKRVADLEAAAKQAAAAPMPEPEIPTPVVLTRYVSQLLYAPSRLQPLDPEIRRVPATDLPSGFQLLRGVQTASRVIGSWQGYSWYITAIELVNQSERHVPLDPRDIRGNFRFRTPQHTSLHPAGSPADRTTFYLISEMPFSDALPMTGGIYDRK